MRLQKLPRTHVLIVGLAVALVVGGVGAASLVAPQERPQVTVDLTIVEDTERFKIMGTPYVAWTFDNTVPGQIIRITQGTDLTIRLHNSATQTHSFHTHIQHYDISSDGTSHTLPLGTVPHQADNPLGWFGPTAFVESTIDNQVNMGVNPIGEYAPRWDHDVALPGEVREYHFAADEVGTFVYHCHVFPVGEHISRGLFGLIEVYPPGWSWEVLDSHRNQGTTGLTTDAWVTSPDGTRYYEDVVVLTELDPTALTEDAGVPTTGSTGKIQLFNMLAWNDPYYLGPVMDGTPMRIVVANMGEEVHSFHIHGHNFDVLDKFDPAKRTVYRSDVLLISPGQSYELTLLAKNEGFWFVHDHMNQNSIAGMIGWLQVNAVE